MAIINRAIESTFESYGFIVLWRKTLQPEAGQSKQGKSHGDLPAGRQGFRRTADTPFLPGQAQAWMWLHVVK